MKAECIDCGREKRAEGKAGERQVGREFCRAGANGMTMGAFDAECFRLAMESHKACAINGEARADHLAIRLLAVDKELVSLREALTLAQQKARAAALEDAAKYVEGTAVVSKTAIAGGLRSIAGGAAGQPERPSWLAPDVAGEIAARYGGLHSSEARSYLKDAINEAISAERTRAHAEGKAEGHAAGMERAAAWIQYANPAAAAAIRALAPHLPAMAATPRAEGTTAPAAGQKGEAE